MTVLIDTNRYSDMARGDAATIDLLEHADLVFMPVIVLGELRAGFLRGARSRANERKLLAFLALGTVRVLLLDETTSLHYAALARQLRDQGTPIPTNDIWIAALALQHGLTLYARDRHFDHLPQLTRL